MKELFKVISISNYDDETLSDVHIVGGLSKDAAHDIARILNQEISGPHARRYFQVVDNNRPLHVFEP